MLKVLLLITLFMQPIGPFAVANLSNVPEEKLIEEVVVTGIRPGPPLWKVKHKDHVLWVFGTVTPIPKRMEWDSEAVEYIIRAMWRRRKSMPR